MIVDALIILCIAALSATLLTLLSLGYATVFILLLSLIGFTNLSRYVPIILLSQIPVSMLAARLRRRLVLNKKHGTINALVLGLSALAGFTAAITLGIRLGDETRVIALIATSILAAVALTSNAKSVNDTKGSSMVTGVIGGLVKGVLGGGVTPVILALQRITGISLDDSMYRTFIALALMSTASAMPYLLAYNVNAVLLVLAIIGGLIGVVLGEKTVSILPSGKREKCTATAYIVLALIATLSLILRLYS